MNVDMDVVLVIVVLALATLAALWARWRRIPEGDRPQIVAFLTQVAMMIIADLPTLVDREGARAWLLEQIHSYADLYHLDDLLAVVDEAYLVDLLLSILAGYEGVKRAAGMQSGGLPAVWAEMFSEVRDGRF